MIVTLQDFQKGAYKLPNAVVEPNGADNTDDIQAYIDRFEREILIKGLGPALYNTVKNSHTGTTLNSDAEQRIKDLVNGVTYEQDGTSVSWEGLKSLSVPYVFFNYWQEFDHIKRDNDEKFDPAPKAVNAYRAFFEKYMGEDPGPALISNGFGSMGVDYYGSRSVDKALRQYLQDKADVYPEAVFTFVENTNRWGI